MMKFFNILILISLTFQLCGQQSWTLLNSPSNTQLNGVYFSNESTGYVVGAAGTIWITNDGGTTWSEGNFKANSGLYALTAFENAAIVVGGLGEAAAANTSASTMWTEQLTPTNTPLFGVYFSTAMQGWAVGGCGTYISTTDGGDNWILTNIDSNTNFNDILFSENIGIIASSDDKLLYSTDNGNNWTPVSVTNARNFRQLAKNDTGFYTISPSSGLYQSNNGLSWSKINSLPIGDYNCVATSSSEIIVSGNNGITYLSEDNGQTWINIIGADTQIRDIHCLDDSTCFAVGKNGNVWKMNNKCAAFTANIEDFEELSCFTPQVELVATTTLGESLIYNWMDSEENTIGTTNPVLVNQAGTYMVLITDEDTGCTTSVSAMVTADVNIPIIDTIISGTLNCYEPIVALSISTSETVEYLWSGPGIIDALNNPSPNANLGGIYSVTITSSINGCTAEGQTIVEQDTLSPIPQIIQPDNLTCINTSADLNASKSFGSDLSFEWQDEIGNSIGNTSTITVSEAGIYNLELTDTQNGCTAQTQINIQENITVPESIINPIIELNCDNNNLVLSIENTSANELNYQWTSTNGNIIGSSTMSTLEIDQTGTYNVVVSNVDNGCSSSSSINIPSFDATISNNGNTDNVVFCEGDVLNIQSNLPNINNVFGNWETNPSFIIVSDNSSLSPSFSGFSLGENQLIWTLYTDDCGVYSSDTLFVEYEGAIPLAIPDAFTLPSDLSEISVNVIANDSIANTFWQMNIIEFPATGDLSYDEFTGIIEYKPDSHISANEYFTYELCNNNCAQCTQASVTLRYLNLIGSEVSLIITPNNDNLNDFLFLDDIENYPNNEVYVFNRWGSLVWSGSGYNNADIRFDGKNLNAKELPEATYYFQAKLNQGEGQYIYGSITIKRS